MNFLTTTFSDIFKSNFLENITSVSILDMLVAIVLAFGLGMFIFLLYKKTYSGVMYSASFGTTLIALTMITFLLVWLVLFLSYVSVPPLRNRLT